VAARCGYADQSHLVRDFGDLLGETPTSFVGRGRRVPIRSRRPREADPTSRRGERGPSGR
ncbi:MAG: hypothetical protein GWN07_21705, partial [Actinobacteria bacterium]|nr:hypothetical protein [Actinomycetota bacterium]